MNLPTPPRPVRRETTREHHGDVIVDPYAWLRDKDDPAVIAHLEAENSYAEADGHVIQHVTSAKLKMQGGSPVALNWAIDAVRKGGTVSVMGAYGPMFSAVRFGDAMNKGLTLRMNQAPVKRQWPRLFEHIRAGHLRPSELITHRIPLDEIAEGYHLFSSKLDDIIKPVIVPAA